MTNAMTAACTRIASTQCGVITRAQALGLGLSTSAIHRLIREGLWLRLLPSVYALWVPDSPPERWRQRLVAGVLWLGEGSAASHRAAALDWGIDGVDTSPFEFSTSNDRRASSPGFIIHRVRELSPDDIALRKGLRVTTVARTIVDLAGVVSPKTLEIALECVRHKKLTTIEEIDSVLQQSGATHKGKAALRSLLESVPSTPTESPLETEAWQFFRAAGLPPPVRQYEVRDKRGRFVARPDFAYPEVKIAIEVDSVKWHSRPKDVVRDGPRQNALIRLGWLPYRISSHDLVNRKDIIAADLREMYVGRRSLGKE